MVEASEDTGARFVVAVEDINGAWSSVQDVRISYFDAVDALI